MQFRFWVALLALIVVNQASAVRWWTGGCSLRLRQRVIELPERSVLRTFRVRVPSTSSTRSAWTLFIEDIPGEFKEIDGVLYYDANRQFSGDESPAFAQPLADRDVRDQLEFLLRSHRMNGDLPVIDVDPYNTRWRRVRRTGQAYDMDFTFDLLSEHPDMAFVGIVTQLYFEELKRWPSTAEQWRLHILELVRTTRARPEFRDFPIQELKYQIEEILKFRTVWYLKLYYFQRHRGTHIEQPFMGGLAAISTNNEQERLRLDQVMKDQFKVFHDPDPRLVDLIWFASLPPLWDLYTVSPPLSLMPKP